MTPLHATRPMAGLPAWVITLDRVGNLTQAQGLTDALGLAVEIKLIAPKGLFGMLAPFGPPPPADRFGKPGSALAPPWPPVVIGVGRSAVPYLRAVKRAAGERTFAIMMMDPRFHHADFDVVWIPEHDQRTGPNVLTTPFSMHSFSPERLAGLRRALPAEVLALPRPRVTVVLGGRNKVFDYPDSDHQRLTRALQSLAKLGCSFLVTPSRRSHPELIEAARHGTEGAPRLIWAGSGENPYGQYLAAADLMVVTGDSANMTSEALATGQPLYVFVPHGTAGKFKLLHEALYATGSARALPDVVPSLDLWPAVPQYATDIIAREVERRFVSRRHGRVTAVGH